MLGDGDGFGNGRYKVGISDKVIGILISTSRGWRSPWPYKDRFIRPQHGDSRATTEPVMGRTYLPSSITTGKSR